MDESTVSKKRGRQAKSQAQQTLSKSKRLPVAADDVSVEERISSLRKNAGILYDSFLHHNLQWGSLSVAWGGEADGGKSLLDKSAYPEEHNNEQTIYFAGRTDGNLDPQSRTWSGSPGELFVGRVALAKPRTVQRSSIGKFQENNRSTRVGVYKRIIHPGEVNRIRSLPGAPHVIATHTDSSIVFVWDTNTQPNRTDCMSDDRSAVLAAPNGSAATVKKKGSSNETCKCSVPDLELIGHTASAEFALDTKGNAKVLSGGSDKQVLLWSILDSANDKNQVRPRNVLSGHQAPVEDCSFRPFDESTDLFCSVGQDRCLFLWDSRQAGYTNRADKIHSDDINCCSWSANDCILTGGSDGLVNIFDIRKVNSPTASIPHRASVINVRWSPHENQVFATSDEAANLTLYKYDGMSKKCEVMFQHLGHRTTIVDVQFNPIQSWVLASVSDDSADEARGGGGTLQVWRVSEFIHKNPLKDPEWAAEMEQVLSKTQKPTSSTVSEEDSGEE